MYDRYCQIRDARGLRDADVVKGTGIGKSTFAEWKSGRSRPKIEKLQKLADYFDVPLEYFTGRAPREPDPTTDHTRWVPVLGRVAAGMPAEMVEDVLDYEEIETSLGDAFALQVRGSSMFPLLIPDDVVIVKCQDDVESGTVAVVSVNGEDATCKKIVKPEGGGVILQPVNPEYAPMFFSDAEIAELPVRILGRVVESRRKF